MMLPHLCTSHASHGKRIRCQYPCQFAFCVPLKEHQNDLRSTPRKKKDFFITLIVNFIMSLYLSFVLINSIVCKNCGNYNGNLNCCHGGGAWENMCGDMLEQRYSWQHGYLICNIPPHKLTSVMILVPGHDGTQRKSQKLYKSLQNVLKSSFPTNTMNLILQCSIYMYDKNMYDKHVKYKSPLFNLCDLQLSYGKWTHHMLKYRGSYDFVAILMDDVHINAEFDIQSFISSMLYNSLNLASASLKHSWHWPVMQKVSNCMVRKTHYSDILFSVFQRESFRCWVNQINLETNPYGWGMDITFPYNCNASIGIMDTHTVVHNEASDPAKGGNRTYDEASAMQQLWNHLNSSNIPELTNIVRYASNPMENLISYINEDLHTCDQLPLYHIVDPTYFQGASHGWHTIMKNLIQHDIGSIHGGHIALIDCCESFFLWQARSISRPWIGIIHFTPNLPNFFPKEETLQALIKSPRFTSALRKCKLLIVLCKTTANWLKLYVNIPIKVIYHPMSTDIQCEQPPVTEQELKFIILLGSQYRHISTIYLLNATHGLSKLWLPGTSDNKKLRSLFDREPESQLQKFDDIQKIHVPIGNYKTLLSNNIVIIDLWDAAANNAILEVIAFNIPAYIKRLPATEEYLGNKYPLFFDDIVELQTMINLPIENITTQREAAKKYLCSDFIHNRQNTLLSFTSIMKSVALSLSLLKHGLNK